MRELPVLDEAGELHPLAYLIARAYMRWPEDCNEADEAVRALCTWAYEPVNAIMDERGPAHGWSIGTVEEVLRENIGPVVQVDDVDDLALATREIAEMALTAELLDRYVVDRPRPEYVRNIYKSFASVLSEGLCAGTVLLTMISFRTHRPELHADSVGKATYLVSLEPLNVLADGRAARYSQDSVIRFWSKHKSTAHLWAALAALQHDTANDESGAVFLGLARSIYEFAATNDLVAGWDPWQVPARIAAVRFEVPSPDRSQMEAVKLYRANTRGRRLS